MIALEAASQGTNPATLDEAIMIIRQQHLKLHEMDVMLKALATETREPSTQPHGSSAGGNPRLTQAGRASEALLELRDVAHTVTGRASGVPVSAPEKLELANFVSAASGGSGSHGHHDPTRATLSHGGTMRSVLHSPPVLQFDWGQPDVEREVDSSELFSDLIFVVIVAEVCGAIRADPSWATVCVTAAQYFVYADGWLQMTMFMSRYASQDLAFKVGHVSSGVFKFVGGCVTPPYLVDVCPNQVLKRLFRVNVLMVPSRSTAVRVLDGHHHDGTAHC